MSHSVPQQPFLTEAARGDAPSTPHADRPLPDFPEHAGTAPHSPFEREIERSERASAALAATRALARASFTDSELAADDAAQAAKAAEGDIDTAGWIRTEYASLDHSVRAPQADVPHGGVPRNLVGGSFNPGIGPQTTRAFASAPIGQSPMRTRTGAQARFMHESRQAPRAERPGAPATSRLDLSAAGTGAHYDKPAVIPMLATPVAAPGVPAAARAPVSAHAPHKAGAGRKFAVAAGVGAVAVVLAGGVAWKAGWLSRNTPSNPSIITAQVAAQAEAARLLAAPPQQEIAVTPAAGTVPHRSDEEVNAALAAAARAAAVPVETVHAAGPARALAPAPLPVPVSNATASTSLVPAAAHASASPAPRAAAAGKDSVAAAIAKAQARADTFLGAGAQAPSAEAPATPAEVKPTP